MKNVNINIYESPQQYQQPCQPQQQHQVKQSSFFIPIPLVLVGILAIPILAAMQRPTVIAPSNPVIVNTNNR